MLESQKSILSKRKDAVEQPRVEISRRSQETQLLSDDIKPHCNGIFEAKTNIEMLFVKISDIFFF